MVFVRTIVLMFLVAFSWSMGHEPSGTLNAFGVLIGVSAFLWIPMLYLQPTYEAWRLKQPNLVAIAALNLLLGWTLLGWVVSFVWALKTPEKVILAAAQDRPASDSLAEDERDCPFCAERIKKAALKCKHCGSSLS